MWTVIVPGVSVMELAKVGYGHFRFQPGPELYDMGKDLVREARAECYLCHVDIGNEDLVEEPRKVREKSGNFFEHSAPDLTRFLKRRSLDM